MVYYCIDGFSCFIIFCCCFINNKVEIVFLSYNEVVCKYGRFWCICSDYGGENVLVWRDMNLVWGEDIRFVIVGLLVYN